MKKILYLSLLLFISSSVFGQARTLSNRRDSIKTYILHELSLKSASRGVTTAVLEYSINMAITYVCTDFPALEKTAWLIIDADSTGTALPTDWVETWMVLKKFDSLWIPMQKTSIDELRERFSTYEKNIHIKKEFSQPGEYYDYGRKLFTHPKDLMPAADPDSLLLFYQAIDGKLTAASDTVTFEPKYLSKLIMKSCEIISNIQFREDRAAVYHERYKE